MFPYIEYRRICDLASLKRASRNTMHIPLELLNIISIIPSKSFHESCETAYLAITELTREIASSTANENSSDGDYA